MIAAILLLAGAPGPYLAAAAEGLSDDRLLAGDSRQDVRLAVLQFPRDSRVEFTRDGDELVARFARPPSGRAIERFRDAAGRALADMRWNDMTLVLRAAPGTDLAPSLVGDRLTVRFAGAPAQTDLAPDAAAEREVELAAIQADLASGYTGAAARRARSLAARHPDNARVRRALADAQAADGDVTGAAEIFRQLGADDPGAQQIIAAAAGTVTAAVTVRDGGGLRQVEGSAQAALPLGGRTSARIGLRAISTSVDEAVTANGVVYNASATHFVAEVGLSREVDPRIRLEISAATDLEDSVTGGVVRVSAGSGEAQFRLSYGYHMPDYSTAEQALQGGFLSRAALGGTLRLSPELVVQADIGLNRYGLSSSSQRDRTVTVAGGAEYLLRRRYPTLVITYRFDAEYLDERRLEANGLPLLPLNDRESHTLAGVSSTLIGRTTVTGSAGWTVDRFGGDGPTASLGLLAPLGRNLQIAANGGVSSVARTGYPSTQLFGRIQLVQTLGDLK